MLHDLPSKAAAKRRDVYRFLAGAANRLGPAEARACRAQGHNERRAGGEDANRIAELLGIAAMASRYSIHRSKASSLGRIFERGRDFTNNAFWLEGDFCFPAKFYCQATFNQPRAEPSLFRRFHRRAALFAPFDM